MRNKDPLIEDLRQAVADQEAVLILGSGVSRAATRGAERAAPTWNGLLHGGLERCRDLGAPSVNETTLTAWKALLDSGDLQSMLTVAGMVETGLRGLSVGEYRNWLRDSFAGLKIVEPAVLTTLEAAECAFLTTNYDDLIEQATGLPGVSWTDGQAVLDALRGERPAVIHLHGKWDDPDSVVLGNRTYDEVAADELSGQVLKALRLTRRFVYVGCGVDGLADPHFASFLDWTAKVLRDDTLRQYCLVRGAAEVEAMRAAHPPERRLFPVSYGEAYEDLAGFLLSLLPEERRREVSAESELRVFVSADMSRYQKLVTELDEHMGLEGKGSKDVQEQIGDLIDLAFKDVGLEAREHSRSDAGDGGIFSFETATLAEAFAERLLLRSHERHNAAAEQDFQWRAFRVGIAAGWALDQPGKACSHKVGVSNRLQAAGRTGEIVLEEAAWELLEDERQQLFLDEPQPVAGKEHDEPIPARRRKVVEPAPWDRDEQPLGKTKVEISEPIRNYLARLVEETKDLHLVGLGKNVSIDLPIDEAYVPLSTRVARELTARDPDQIDPAQLREDEAQRVEFADAFGSLCDFRDKRGIVVLGEPGAGKTTGARQLAWRLADGGEAPGLSEGIVPVFLRLRFLQREQAEQKLKDFVAAQTVDEDSGETPGQPGRDLWAHRPLLWIFDGLDEVVDEDTRAKVASRIKKLLTSRPSDYVLVTSRFQGYGQSVNLGGGFVEFHVQPLDDEQVRQFVEQWFGAACRQLYGQDAKARAKAKEDSLKLLELLTEKRFTVGRMRELRTNPLLLTLVCLVFHETHDLPRRRAELYGQCIRVLLEHWRREVRESAGVAKFDEKAARCVLSHLAWWMHCESMDADTDASPAVDRGELERRAVGPLAAQPPDAGLGADGPEFIRRMIEETGILAVAGPGKVSFMHLSFQEFLAAQFAIDEQRGAELAGRLGESWWRETIHVAMATAPRLFLESFFAALLKDDWRGQADLFAQCWSESAVRAIEPLLERLTASQDPGEISALLLILRHDRQPELLAACEELFNHAEEGVVTAAAEILDRAGRLEFMEVFGATTSATTTPAPRLYFKRVDEHTGLTIVSLPEGRFQMGDENDGPIHEVTLSPFRISAYPVTNADYERFLAASDHRRPGEWDNRRFNQPDQPVVGVSWEDARAYCEWAECRLPTEAEWEYACRAGSTTHFCFGDDEARLEEYAWYGKNSDEVTHAVGGKKANEWGLHDMHGNVWEWCADWYGTYLNKAVNDPQGPNKGVRVLRGGSWARPAELCRSAYRGYAHPYARNEYVGFRVVLARRSAEPKGKVESLKSKS